MKNRIKALFKIALDKTQVRKLLNRRFTLMIVPHAALRPLHLHFTVSFGVFMLMGWTLLTSWASWAVFSNIDYWSMRLNHQVLKLKVQYFATELRKSRELLDQVREADIQLRKLLGLKNKSAIIEGQEPGQGGPAAPDISILQKELKKKLWEISENEIRYEARAIQDESAKRIQSYKELSELIAYERGLFRSTPQGWPALGRMTSHFGSRSSPFRGSVEFHSGIDIANERGTPVRATADGIVQRANWQGGYGRLVIIDHGFGYITYYGHNSALAVKDGDRVERGQILAYMGSSGSSTGDHTHYEVWLHGRPVNPWRYLTVKSVDELRGKEPNLGLVRKP